MISFQTYRLSAFFFFKTEFQWRPHPRLYGDDLVLMPESRDKWLLSKVLQDSFFDKEPVSGASPSEIAEEDDNAPLSTDAPDCIRRP